MTISASVVCWTGLGFKEWNAIAYPLVTPSTPSLGATTRAQVHVQDLHTHHPPPFYQYIITVELIEQRNFRVQNIWLQAWYWIYFDWILLCRYRSIPSRLYTCFMLSLCTAWGVEQLHGHANSSKVTRTAQASKNPSSMLISWLHSNIPIFSWLLLSPSHEGTTFIPKISLSFSVSLTHSYC